MSADNEVTAALAAVTRYGNALAAVESRHRRGDWTEDGWIGNSIDGHECRWCGEDWPCSAQRLRAAALAIEPAMWDVELVALTLHNSFVNCMRPVELSRNVCGPNGRSFEDMHRTAARVFVTEYARLLALQTQGAAR